MSSLLIDQRDDHLACVKEDRTHRQHVDLAGHPLRPPPAEAEPVEEGHHDTATASRTSREEFHRFYQRMADNEKVKKAVLSGETTHIPISMGHRCEILDEYLSILMMEIEGSREHIMWAEYLLENPAEMDEYDENPESLHRQIAEQRAHIMDVRPKILRLNELLMDTLSGKFDCHQSAL